MYQLHTPFAEKGVGCDEEGVGPLARKPSEDLVYFLTGAGLKDFHYNPYGASSRFGLSHALNTRCCVRIDEHGNALRSGYQLPQQFKAFRHQFGCKKVDAGRVATGPG